MLERLRAAARPLPHHALPEHGDELVALAKSYGFSNVRVFGAAVRRAAMSGTAATFTRSWS